MSGSALYRSSTADRLLAAAAGTSIPGGKPADVQRRERWEEVAVDAAIVADKALTAAADGLSLQRASERLINHGARKGGERCSLTPLRATHSDPC